jgi:UDP-glucose 4-epimerase
MRIAVTGASGNIGVHVLRQLHADPGVSQVVAICRRPPARPTGALRERVRWIRADVSRASSIPILARAFTDCDTVIHLAWLIQPSRAPDVLRATNVDGTGHVLAAVRNAGVPAFVHASSVGAYSPARQSRRRDETWPTDGIPGSLYSAHKAEVERMLDDVEREQPALRVVRIRPSIAVSGTAAASQTRLFLGPLAPRRLLRFLPLVPWHRGMVMQVVHSEDAAAAFFLAAVRDVRGAFNIADEPPLTARIAGATLGARTVPMPLTVARALVELTWRLRLHPADRGWLELAVRTPLMDTVRARTELGWTARHDARFALREALTGFERGTGGRTPALRPIRSVADQVAGGLRSLTARSGGRI